MRRFFLLFAFFAGVTVAADRDNSDLGAEAWLAKMTASAQQLNYVGSFIYYHEKRMDSMHITHAFDGSVERERLVSLNGESHEIRRNNGSVRYVLPGSQVLPLHVVKQRLVANLAARIPEQLNRLKKLYLVTLVDSDRIAGRDAQLIALVPVDQFRFGYLIWADKETGLLLRADLLNEENEAIEHFMFTSVTFKKTIADGELAQQVVGTEIDWQVSLSGEEDRVVDKYSWVVDELPGGFEAKAVSGDVGNADHDGIEHMMFTDGLASVSVFVEKITAENPGFHAETRVGAISTYARIAGDYQVTVVGEVPLATTEMIGNSLHLKAPEL